LEEPFWCALREIAEQKSMTLAALVAAIDAERTQTGLSSAVRIYVLEHFRKLAHQNASEATENPNNSNGANKDHSRI